jgi:hypothetical protein
MNARGGLRPIVSLRDVRNSTVNSFKAPALDAIEYEEITLQNSFDEPSIFRGPLTQEREDAWHDLYRCMYKLDMCFPCSVIANPG